MTTKDAYKTIMKHYPGINRNKVRSTIENAVKAGLSVEDAFNRCTVAAQMGAFDRMRKSSFDPTAEEAIDRAARNDTRGDYGYRAITTQAWG